MSATVPTAHAQRQTWLTRFGTPDNEWAIAMASDGAGGAFVAGSTRGEMSGQSFAYEDAYVGRFDGDGNQLWIRQFAEPGSSYGAALASDHSGGVFVAGGTLGSHGGPSAGGLDVFLARYNSAGEQVWIRQFGTSEWDVAAALSTDHAGNLWVAGQTTGNLGGPNAGGKDGFVARFGFDGNQVWISQFGSDGNDYGYAIAADGAGGVVVGGETGGDLGGPNAGSWDAYVSRYDSAGNPIWMHQFGTQGGDAVLALEIDSSGGVFAGGNITGGSHATGYDAFLTHYDRVGTQSWFKQFGPTANDGVRAMVYDEKEGLLVAGYTLDTTGSRYSGISSNDAFVARYDETGERHWYSQFGQPRVGEICRGIAFDGAEGVLVSGYTVGFRSNPNLGGYDAFIARHMLSSCGVDCDDSTGNGVLDIFDFLCWQNQFVMGNPYACDCDTSTGPRVCDMLDFICYQESFVAGCP